MSNPTTPFGWQMPEPTDLVTDLPADFEVFGQAVATDLQYLLGGTTGQVLAKASGTDLDFDWVTDASGMTNPMTTTADVIYSSSGSTPARLGIGTANQVLAVNSGATAPEWQTISSGGMTLISTTTLSGTTTTLSSIPQTYKNLQVVVTNPDSNNNPVYLKLQMNGDSTSNGHRYNSTYGIATTSNDTSIDVAFNFNTTTTEGVCVVDLYDYASTTNFKIGHSLGFVNNVSTPTNFDVRSFDWIYVSNNAITSLKFLANVGSFTAGTVLLYGVK
jgi:hypothetical protein